MGNGVFHVLDTNLYLYVRVYFVMTWLLAVNVTYTMLVYMFSSDLLIKIFVRHVLTSYFSLAFAGNNTIKVVRFGKV